VIAINLEGGLTSRRQRHAALLADLDRAEVQHTQGGLSDEKLAALHRQVLESQAGIASGDRAVAAQRSAIARGEGELVAARLAEKDAYRQAVVIRQRAAQREALKKLIAAAHACGEVMAIETEARERLGNKVASFPAEIAAHSEMFRLVNLQGSFRHWLVDIAARSPHLIPDEAAPLLKQFASEAEDARNAALKRREVMNRIQSSCRGILTNVHALSIFWPLEANINK